MIHCVQNLMIHNIPVLVYKINIEMIKHFGMFLGNYQNHTQISSIFPKRPTTLTNTELAKNHSIQIMIGMRMQVKRIGPCFQANKKLNLKGKELVADVIHSL